MTTAKYIKFALLGGWVIFISAWLFYGTFSKVSGTTEEDALAATEAVNALPTPDPAKYVGSETCKACHEPQFNSVAHTKHGQLENVSSWKDKVVGCESCHGPGKEHVDGGGDKTKIRVFKELDAKTVSQTCLTCHAGKENHNNFLRGEHWRNNVGCTDCHTAHGPDHGAMKTDSITFIGDVAREKPNEATAAMLKQSEPQLCISCHSEMKSQFSKPFRHKVLEGAMKCSDCHNPHGGFENRQSKLSVGVDTACVRCHMDKQGPFVYEHAPLKVEGCAACHTPHGSANPKMLKRAQVRQLCLECHSGITEQISDEPGGGPHDQRNLRSRSCTNCHVMIHGSNAHQAFFR